MITTFLRPLLIRTLLPSPARLPATTTGFVETERVMLRLFLLPPLPCRVVVVETDESEQGEVLQVIGE